MNKIAIYTANINDYDEVRDHFFMDRDIDYYYFTNGNKVPKGSIHVRVTEEMFPKEMPSVQKARLIKANPYHFIPNAEQYECIIWIDACFKQTATVKPLFEKMKGKELLTMKHPQRDCIYEEANACIEMGIGDKEAIQKHYRKLADIPYPAKNGLAATGIMFRRNTENVRSVCNLWYASLSKDVYRDQLFFDWACWMIGFEYATFDFSERNNYFYNHLHDKPRL